MTAITVEKELLELEREYWRAMQERDVDAAMRLTDFPCLISGPHGVARVDQQAFAGMMKNPPYTIHKVELGDDVQVRLLTDDLAVLAYRVHEELTVDGKPISIDAADSSTWIQRSGQWRCALHTESIAGDPFGRDKARDPATATDRASAGNKVSDDERAIRGLIDAWMAAHQSGQVSKVLNLMADDVIFMVPGREPFGKEAFAAGAREMKDVRIEGTSEIQELEVAGDWAWCRTRLSVSMTPSTGATTRRSGYTLTVFRKQPSGAWALARDANLLMPSA